MATQVPFINCKLLWREIHATTEPSYLDTTGKNK